MTLPGEERADAGQKRRPYRCFLVRCRLEDGSGPGGEPAWRFTVQQVGPLAARGAFACLDDVAAHIAAELASYTPPHESKRTIDPDP